MEEEATELLFLESSPSSASSVSSTSTTHESNSHSSSSSTTNESNYSSPMENEAEAEDHSSGNRNNGGDQSRNHNDNEEFFFESPNFQRLHVLVPPGTLGITMRPFRKKFGLPGGMEVTKVKDDGQCFGLVEKGDYVTSIDGENIDFRTAQELLENVIYPKFDRKKLFNIFRFSD